MSRRQSYPETTRKTGNQIQQIKDLKLEIQLKNHEIEDLKFELNALKKKQSIWHHLGEAYEKTNQEEEHRMALVENQKLKSQLVSMLTEIQHKSNVINQQAEKINDLKQYNMQLKKLSDKVEVMHKRQLELVQSQINSSQGSYQIEKLRKQKERLESALADCANITKEMQEFYMNEIDGLKSQLEQQRNVIVRLQNSKRAFENQLQQKDQQLKQIKIRTSLKVRIMDDGNKEKQNDLNQQIKRQNMQKKWELILSQVRQRYEKEILDLKNQIKFLIVKVQSLQDSKNYQTFNISSFNLTNGNNTIGSMGLSSSILTNSKLAMSSSSNDSYRYSQNNSFSSSIKQSLSRKDLVNMKTPCKNTRQSSGGNYVIDRTNF